jgi:tRNA nucleotidyltransferase/poly(A) polymerase
MLSLDMIAEVFVEEEAWVVGGAIRDDLLGGRRSTSTSRASSPSARARARRSHR